MKLLLAVALAVLTAAPFIRAAQLPAIPSPMHAALDYRAELATAVAKNTESPESALKRLSARSGASGLSVTSDADLGYAALDVGRRLVSLNRADAAEVFFRAAEKAFERAANQTTPEQAREKAQYLQKLATVRANYLNKSLQAKADIDEAIRLQPEDKSLEQARAQLARGRPEAFKTTGKK